MAVLRRRVRHRDRVGPAAGGAGDRLDPLDPDALAALILLAAHNPQKAKDLVRQFLRDARTRLDALHAAVEQEDADALDGVAHAFKGSAATLAARHVAARCAELEQAARTDDFAGAAAVLERLDIDYTRAAVALRRAFDLGDR